MINARAFKDLEVAEIFRDFINQRLIKIEGVRSIQGIYYNCVNLDTGELMYSEKSEICQLEL